MFLYHPSIIIGIHNHPLYRQCHVGRTKTEVVQPILAASMRDVSSPCGTSAPPIRREHSVWPSPTPRALSRTLKVRGGMISQAHRYLGCFCSSQRIFLPQIIQVLRIDPEGTRIAVVIVVPPPRQHRSAQHPGEVGELDIALQPTEGLAPKILPDHGPIGRCTGVAHGEQDHECQEHAPAVPG